MVDIGIIVEGETEMEFINSVLNPFLLTKDIDMKPKMIGSGSRSTGGGNVTVDCLVTDMSESYMQHGAVTSLVDFYGFQGKENKDVDELETHLMNKIIEKIGHKPYKNKKIYENKRQFERKVIPYVQKYEFEALLFSDINAFSSVLEVSDESIELLSAVVSNFDNPEEINDSTKTAPSKRIANIISRYNKRIQGPLVAEKIGIDRIRSECPRFDKWVENLEALGTSN